MRDARSGEPQHDNVDNVRFFLSQLAAEVRYNAWLERPEIRGYDWRDWCYVDDAVVAKLRMRGSQTGTRFRPGKDFMWDAILTLAHERPVDPAIEQLAELESEWDGNPRLDRWLAIACGVPDDHYHRAVGRNIVGGMVRRARKPGCKHDTMAVLHGPQGTGKSSLASIIALEPDFFSDEIELGEASKELVLSLAGKMVAELGEMGAKRGMTAAHIKAMISRQVDRGRTAYARTVTARPRRNIFIGTVNDDQPLSDPTGNRRFLPVCCRQAIDLRWLKDNIRQIVGEAAHCETAGETFEMPAELWVVAAAHQSAATDTPDWEICLQEWLAPTAASVFVTYADLGHLVRTAAGRSVRPAQYNAAMERLGFCRTTKRVEGRPTGVWCRGDTKGALRATAGYVPGGVPRVRMALTLDDAPPLVPGA